MTSGDGTTGATRLCKNPACGKSFTVGLVMRERQAARYCTILCREQAQTARQTERERQAREQAAAREPIACTICGKPFVPRNKTYKTCGEECLEEAGRRKNRAQGAVERARLAASKAAPPRPAPTVCADCGKPARRDTDSRNLVYCTYRCGWSVLLTAKDRDVRADAADPTPDPEEDVSEEDLADDDCKETEGHGDETPAPEETRTSDDDGKPAQSSSKGMTRSEVGRLTEARILATLAAEGGHAPTRTVMHACKLAHSTTCRALQRIALTGAVRYDVLSQHWHLTGKKHEHKAALGQVVRRDTAAADAAVLAALAAGHTEPGEARKAAGMEEGTWVRTIARLVKQGRVTRTMRPQNRPRYALAAGAAPPPPKPAPVRNASVTPAPASLRAQIAALPPGELLALLADLEPVGQHARALCAALAALQR